MGSWVDELTLGMGTGKLMGQLMRGESPDLDLSLFALGRDSNAVHNSTLLKSPEEEKLQCAMGLGDLV